MSNPDTKAEFQIVVKTEPEDVVAEDSFYGYKITVNKDDSDTEDGDYGNMFLVKTRVNSIDEGQPCTSKVKFESDDSEFSESWKKRKLEDTVSIDVSCHGNDDTQSKLQNRRKRKETVRRIKVQNSNEDNIPDLKHLEDVTKTTGIHPIHMTCVSCKEIFNDAKNFQEHAEICKHTKSRACKKSPSSKKPSSSVIKKKGRKRTEKIPHTCDICGKTFRDRRGLERHGPVHTGLRPFQCKICERAYTQKGHLQQHMKIHNDSNESLECEYCFKVSQRRDKYIHHMTQHTRVVDLPYWCNSCGGQFEEKEELLNHITKHRNTDLYFVRELRFSSGSAETGVSFLTHYSELDNFVYACQLCKKEFNDWFTIQEHLCRHTRDDFLLKCQTCGQTFKVKDEFKKHQQVHSSDCSFRCDVCGMYHHSNMDMISHKYVHMVVSTPMRRNSQVYIEGQFSGFDVEEGMPEDSNSTLNNTENVPLYRKVFNDVTKKNLKPDFHSEAANDNAGKIDRDAETLNGDFQKDQGTSQNTESNGTSQIQWEQDISQNSNDIGINEDMFNNTKTDVTKATMELNMKSAVNVSGQKLRGEFYCNICNAKFLQGQMLRLHAAYCGNEKDRVKIRMIGKKKRYECPICGKTFSDRRGIERHGPVHSGVKAFECNVCGRSYTQKGHLEVHQKKHKDNYSQLFECRFCLKVFEKRERLIRHEGLHVGNCLYTCNICCTFHPTLEDLYAHFKTHEHHQFYFAESKGQIRHADSNRKQMSDELRFQGSASFQECSTGDESEKIEMIKILPPLDCEYIYTCQICRKQLQSWKILIEHLDRHFGMVCHFQCETCKEILPSADELQTHIYSHQDEYSIKCPVCFQFFTDNEDLIGHFKVHARKAHVQKRAFYNKQQKFFENQNIVDNDECDLE